MSAKVFLDTNVLVYAYDTADATRMATARGLLETALRTDNGCLSTQVLGEFFVTVTRKIKVPLSSAAASQIVGLLGELTVVGIDLLLVRQAIRLQADAGISYWDALILAAAARSHCAEVLTEDLNPGQVLLGVRVVNPFAPRSR